MVPVVLLLPDSGRCAGRPLLLLLEVLSFLLEGPVCQRSFLLEVLQVRSGSCLVVSGNFRVLIEERLEKSLVLVMVVVPDYCCSLGTFLQLGLGSMFCCTQGSQIRSLWRMLSVLYLVCCKYSTVGWTSPGVLTYCIPSSGIFSIPVMQF